MLKKIFASIPRLRTWNKDGLIHRRDLDGTQIEVRVDNIEGFDTCLYGCDVFHFDGERASYDVPFSHILYHLQDNKRVVRNRG